MKSESLEKAKKVSELAKKGTPIAEACAQVGLGVSNYYLLKKNNNLKGQRKYKRREVQPIDIPVESTSGKMMVVIGSLEDVRKLIGMG